MMINISLFKLNYAVFIFDFIVLLTSCSQVILNEKKIFKIALSASLNSIIFRYIRASFILFPAFTIQTFRINLAIMQ